VGFAGKHAPLAVFVIANRQRALGNILHDAGHRNLWCDKCRYGLLMTEATHYRQTSRRQKKLHRTPSA